MSDRTTRNPLSPGERTMSSGSPYLCHVCGTDIGWNAPSGVCSAACLDEGQRFSDPVHEHIDITTRTVTAFNTYAELCAVCRGGYVPMISLETYRKRVLRAALQADGFRV